MTYRYQPRRRDLIGGARALVVGSPVTIAIIGVNALMYCIQTVLYGGTDAAALYRMGAKFGPAIQDGDWYRLVAPVLLHGGLLHLTVNNLGLLMIGPVVERLYGRLNFAVIYVVAGFWGVVASFVNSPTLSVGASGALFGAVGALAIFLLLNRRMLGPEERRLLGTVVVLIAANLLLGQFWPGIDQAAHVGGLIGGVAMALACTPRLGLRLERSLVDMPAGFLSRIRPSPTVVLLALLFLQVLAGVVAYWWAQTVEYGPGIMLQYRSLLWEISVRDQLGLPP